MDRYANLSGDSGVNAYEIRQGAIEVEFVDGRIYLYTNKSAGPAAIARMRRLAKRGKGLSTYISREVRSHYAERWR